METALISWIIIAVGVTVVMINEIFRHRNKSFRTKRLGVSQLHVIEVGEECDELFIPGDINSHHDSDIIEYDEEMI